MSALVSLCLFSSISQALAQTNIDTAVKLSAKPQIGLAGTVFKFSAQNFAPNETIATYVKWPEKYDFVEADVLFETGEDGSADWSWDSSDVPPGNYTMVVVSQTNPARTASLVFTILEDSSTNSYRSANYNFTTQRLWPDSLQQLQGR